MKPRDLVARSVKRLRMERGWNQDELGAHVADYVEYPWTRQTVSDAENGRRAFTAEDVIALALTFDVPISALFQVETMHEQIELGSRKNKRVIQASEIAAPFSYPRLMEGEDRKLLEGLLRQVSAGLERAHKGLDEAEARFELVREAVLPKKKGAKR